MPERNRRTVYSTDPESERAPTDRPTQQTPPPRQQPVSVGIERKGRGGKTVTVVKGIQGAPAALDKLCKQLKGRLGTGGAVKDGVIEIQGDQRDRVVQMLVEMGYKAKKAGG
ncbi:MAG: translation initiation factor [Caldilineaceae bacterium]|nr:translation initiation factor [Caldilineaceae bacterium]